MPEATYPHVYRIQAQGLLFGIETINNFFYGGADPFGSIPDAVSAWESLVFSQWYPCVSVHWTLQNVNVQHMRGGSDFGSVGIGDTGTVSGDCLPPFVCWDFTYLRAGFHERNGYKRFAGVAEADQGSGEASTSALTRLTALQAALGSTLTVDTVVYDILIQRTVINHAHLVDPSYWTCGGVVYSKIGSQNSRKYGHGQ